MMITCIRLGRVADPSRIDALVSEDRASDRIRCPKKFYTHIHTFLMRYLAE